MLSNLDIDGLKEVCFQERNQINISCIHKVHNY